MSRDDHDLDGPGGDELSHRRADPTVEMLRGALMREAARVEPSGDGLRRIRETIESGPARGRAPLGTAPRPGRRWTPLLAAAGAAVVLATAGTVAVRERDGASAPAASSAATALPAPSGGPTGSAAPDPSGSPTGTGATPVRSTSPVYWLGSSKTRTLLYREWVPTQGYSMQGAVEAMLGGSLPKDKDFSTPWRPAPVRVERSGGVITVDLGAAAFSNRNVGSEVAALAVQQLVHTVTAVSNSPGVPVRVLVDGATGYEAWGVLRLGDPIARDPSVIAPVWAIEPQEGETVRAGRVTVKGAGTGFEGVLAWDVVDANRRVVRSGTATGGAEGRPKEFTFTVQLRPGRYTLTIYQPDESDGESPEGPRGYADTKTFTVR